MRNQMLTLIQQMNGPDNQFPGANIFIIITWIQSTLWDDVQGFKLFYNIWSQPKLHALEVMNLKIFFHESF